MSKVGLVMAESFSSDEEDEIMTGREIEDSREEQKQVKSPEKSMEIDEDEIRNEITKILPSKLIAMKEAFFLEEEETPSFFPSSSTFSKSQTFPQTSQEPQQQQQIPILNMQEEFPNASQSTLKETFRAGLTATGVFFPLQSKRCIRSVFNQTNTKTFQFSDLFEQYLTITQKYGSKFFIKDQKKLQNTCFRQTSPFAPQEFSSALREFVSTTENYLKSKKPKNSFFSTSTNQDQISTIEQYLSIWKLFQALFDFISCSETENEEISRKNKLSRWLAETLSNSTLQKMKDLENKKQKQNSPKETEEIVCEMIYQYLLGGKTQEAINLALENKDFFLSTLISTSCSQRHNFTANNETSSSTYQEFKGDLKEQIKIWKLNGSLRDGLIAKSRFKIYCLLAGQEEVEELEPEYQSLSFSSGNEKEKEVLDWKRVLGKCVWYICEPSATIQDIIDIFNQNWVPEFILPPFLESIWLENPKNLHKLKKQGIIFKNDICYLLLQLYCDISSNKKPQQTFPLDLLLHPLSYSSSESPDFSLSWHIFWLISKRSQGLQSEKFDLKIHTQYANQLESLGLWEWSIFVLLHAFENSNANSSQKLSNLRAFAVEKCLERNFAQYKDKEKQIASQKPTISNSKDRQMIELLKIMLPVQYFANAEDVLRQSKILIDEKEFQEKTTKRTGKDSEKVMIMDLDAMALMLFQ